MIEARNLRLGYRDSTVLDGVSIEVCAGDLLAIIGPNGAGKTTLLRALGGLHRPSGGSVNLDGRAIEQLSCAERARRVAIIEVDAAPVTDMTVREIVMQGRLPHRAWWRWTTQEDDDGIVEGALGRTSLLSLAEREFETLSSGERQRVWVAMALAQEAPALLFDEPTTHLDLRHALEVLALLRALSREGSAVCVVLHDLNLAAAFADRIALLGQRRLLACASAEAVFREDLLSKAYETPIVVRRDDGGLFAFAQISHQSRQEQSSEHTEHHIDR